MIAALTPLAYPDDLKFHSSMALFHEASASFAAENAFGEALKKRI